MGTATVAVDLEAHDQDIVKTLPSSDLSVTYRLHEPGRIVADAPRCRVFALIVGIDKYMASSIPDLRGCVNDAQTMRIFLTNRFNIPEKQVAFLANQEATRDAILRTFRTHLIENPDIENGDTMIIYYAGHGSRVKAPESWPSTDGKIETFVPHDERGKDAQGELVHGIPDRTMGVLLSQLATAKGSNITVVLDCCHSGSLTRVSSPPNILPVSRYVDTPTPIPEHLDHELLATSRMAGPDTSYEFMDSHILLAACRYQQRARECISAITGSPCGFFTDGLLRALRGIGPLNRVTYAELLDMLPALPDQNPQCEGANKGRFIFQGEKREVESWAIQVNEDGTLKVLVGSMFGVVIGTQFVSEKDPQTDPDRVFVAVSVDLDSAILMPRAPQVLPSGTRLVVADWKNEAAMMKVYIQPDEDLPLSASDLLVPRTKPKFLVVASRDAADLVIKRTSKEEITLTRLDAHLARYDAPDVLLNISAVARIPYVLDSVGRFNYFLAKHNTRDVLDLGGDVQLEMHRLTGEFGFRVPDTEFGNMVVDGEMRFQLDPEAKYGFAICNYSKYDLFPYLFYFDPATYSIDAWYLPESKTMAAPLPARGDSNAPPARITIGYGTGGVYAFQFVVPDGINTDTGFLKLFVSTTYLDLESIEQAAAVDVSVGQGRGEEAGRPLAIGEGVWGGWDFPITIFVEEGS
ncbi:caspase domain-containing protein [Roridomyces roridus]|uniref:Caspase domain-containing protein n=1 Tax=Roridomyces roridus TaxID=1738132 RepID=A0AAD7BCF9_9AGAR|nr:caspase domain-containing protein [Roridomyces roridus]